MGRQRAYRGLCEAKLRGAIPFRITDSQKQEIANRILDGQLHTDLFVLLQDKSSKFHCPICMDPLASLTVDRRIDTSNVWFAPLRKTEHWSNHPCGHACCRSCMTKWTETAINDQKLRIKCPAENCPYSLYDQYVQDLVSCELF